MLANVPPVLVPSSFSVELAPGVELAKNTSMGADVDAGTILPTNWGNGVPMVVPNLAFVNCTPLAVSAFSLIIGTNTWLLGLR